MNLHYVRVTLVLLGATAVFAAVVGMDHAELPVPAVPSRRSNVSSDSLDQLPRPTGLLQLSKVTTPFRASRKAPTARWDEQGSAPHAVPPPLPRPTLLLSGVLWGDAPAAIIEGLPGHDNPVVLRLGERDGPWQIRRIDSTTVTIAGLDTVWVLKVREPWR